MSCDPFGDGTLTGVIAGNGLIGGGNSGNVSLAVAVPLYLSGTNPNGVIQVENTATSGAVTAALATTGSSQGVAMAGIASANSGFVVGVEGSSSSPSGIGVFAINDAATGQAEALHAQTGSNAGVAVFGLAYATVGSNTGVWGTTNSPTGKGVWGRAADLVGAGLGNGVGVLGESLMTGVRGNSTSASGYGVLGDNAAGTGVSGTGTVGVNGAGSTGVQGVGGLRGILGTGATGVRGESANGSGSMGTVGVNNSAVGSGTTWGVYGQTTTSGGYGVEGYNPNGVGVRGNGGVYAGQFLGNVTVTGTLSKAAGSFRIDHPLDPANKYLYHSLVESPDMKNIHDGVAILDARGETQVELANEIYGNRFRIAGGIPGQRISWQVTGTRKDAYAEAHRIAVEVDKPDNERGKYLHPQLYGQPASKAVFETSPALKTTPAQDAWPLAAMPEKGP